MGRAITRRFFECMSTEFAYEENQQLVPTANADKEENRKEIRELSRRIKAVSVLETNTRAIKRAESYGATHARYFLLQFDYATKEVSVEPFFAYSDGASKYISEERNNQGKNTVLVEVNKVAELKAAFPNYFLDAGVFTEKLKAILMPNYRTSQAYDLSWLSRYR